MEWAKDIPCKNINIHGYCKYENKGCAFKHDFNMKDNQTPPSSASKLLNAISIKTSKKFNMGSQSFKPLKKKFAVSASKLDNIPVFVPSTIFKPSSSSASTLSRYIPIVGLYAPVTTSATSATAVSAVSAVRPELFFSQPIQYHCYAPAPPPHFEMPIEPYQRNPQSFFLDNNLRESLQKKNEATNQVLPNFGGLPENIHIYHSLVLLDNFNHKVNLKYYGVPSSLYKVYSNYDGNVYALRRLEGFKITDEKSISSIKAWSSLKCANVVKLHEAFTSMAFGDNSLFLVYDFYPLAKTLKETHFGDSTGALPVQINEPLLWNYMVQITNALICIHEMRLAARSLSINKIIVTNQGRIRLSDCGTFDIIKYSRNNNLIDVIQKEDILKFADIILTLAKSSLPAGTWNQENSILIKFLPFSENFKKNLNILYAMAQSEESSLSQLKLFASDISLYAMKTIDYLQNSCDFMESQLSKEVENGRLFRLVTKLGFINERPEFDHDPSWSESGDRYPIKLFRDYLFHQVDSSGRPVLDLSHVLTCLNKLDTGIEEKILLVAPNEQNCIIISYKELKDCIESAFHDLSRYSN
ncbi:PAN-complex poly(A)-binding subunit PAN3 ASCRUDRAFT_82155 [Ascoidea rubescens DSM 1968]|uniref:PAN2-PAN3 deadenylation complex subunit PAN3 n=1 Tax=Ascoidea rubescens DSM 1968 TaxID=1344418 RepID=A0A1D2VCC7_9ASCO|nr:hypothetical protein ASCRUDRAFT_82155 [Ascoidea rubescens DSM 1968]ODV59133.1 hypothetical protein ASCRUDRAFT_82155 [Ascoidea rubescens DSM 1968]